MSQQYTKDEIITALHEARGMVTVAAQKLKCSPVTVYNWLKKSPDCRAVIDQERERVIDTAELGLMKAINNSESWAIAFALKTIGKQRGYVERIEIDVRLLAVIKQLEGAAQGKGIDLADALNDFYAELSQTVVSADAGEGERAGG